MKDFLSRAWSAAGNAFAWAVNWIQAHPQVSFWIMLGLFGWAVVAQVR